MTTAVTPLMDLWKAFAAVACLNNELADYRSALQAAFYAGVAATYEMTRPGESARELLVRQIIRHELDEYLASLGKEEL